MNDTNLEQRCRVLLASRPSCAWLICRSKCAKPGSTRTPVVRTAPFVSSRSTTPSGTSSTGTTTPGTPSAPGPVRPGASSREMAGARRRQGADAPREGRAPAPRGGYYRWGEVLDHAEAGSMRRFARTDLLAEAGPVEEFSAESAPEAVADGITEVLTAPRCFDCSHMYAMVVWELPPGAERPEDVAADDPARSTYIQCAGSTGVMTVEIRVTGQDGSYKHYVVAREPVADPESWMGIEWDTGEGGPAAVRVHPEEVFTGEQAAPVFRAYVVDGRLPAPELLRPLDI